MLAGNAQGRAVFHQADIVDVWHFGATHALLYPAHHVTQQALSIVFDFFADLFGVPLCFGNHRYAEQGVEEVVTFGAKIYPFQLFLNRLYINLVVMQRMQRRRRG
ncbi:hypothetical protein D3C80_1686960 [compost metagenome]